MTEGNQRVFCIGETVFDIIFKDEIPVAAKPGGSMLNTAVSLGRAGAEVYFISDFAHDHAGKIIGGFLERNGVSTRFTHRYDEGKTALALAFLNDRQDAVYSFYKEYPPVRMDIDLPESGEGDIVLFGSFFALTEAVRSKLTGFIRESRKKGAFVIYDPNFRRPHLSELDKLMPWILENIGMADLVRGSDEDFELIFSTVDAAASFEQVNRAGCPTLIYTRNEAGAEFITSCKHLVASVPQIDPVSTIGAGDAFNAGIIYAMLRHSTALPGIPDQAGTGKSNEKTLSLPWEAILAMGIQFSEDVCMSLENYISLDFSKSLDR